MSIVHAPWWCIEMPDEWQAEEDDEDEVILIIDPDDLGELCITAIKKQDGLIDKAELLESAADLVERRLTSTDVGIAGLTGIYFEYEQEGEAWREWYLTDGSTMLYATYNCDSENAQIDAAVIDQMLESLVLVDNSEAATEAE